MAKAKKNANYRYAENKQSAKNGKGALIKFIAIFLGAVLLLFAVLGAVSALWGANDVVKYGGVGFDAGVVNYLLSYYKYNYLKVLRNTVPTAADTEWFWSQEESEGVSYGDSLRDSAREYIKELIVSVYLYDSYSRLSSEERGKIKDACREVLLYKASSDEDRFNALSEPHGFDYSDFEAASTVLYKSYKAKELIYGTDGSKLEGFSELCNEYLEKEYAHVRLMFIRTETKFVLDENGNRVIGDDGRDLTEKLSDDEKAQRLAAIEELDLAIFGKENDLDMQISPEMFSLYQERYSEGDSSKNQSGYYFADGAEYTEEFRSAYASVVDTALAMKVGDYKRVSTDAGVCYIYRIAAESGAYTDTSDGFFSDFYTDCANYSFSSSLTTLSKDVSLTEKYEECDIVAIPYNSDLIAFISG